jgi:endonuclease G
MNKIILAMSMILVSANSYAWTQHEPLAISQCAVHAPYGVATTTKSLQAICRRAYLSEYDQSAKIPNYVSYTLQPTNALGCVARSDAFVADASVIDGPSPNDYVGTQYDKGHMNPAGDQAWDTQVEFESFLMTNMTPQAGSLNRGIWKLLETSVRGWVVQLNQPYTVYVGAIYALTDKKIGKGVVVPHALYKIVINNVTGEVAGWEFPHVAPYPVLGNNLSKFRKPIADIQKEAGVTYRYPVNAKELVPGKEWLVNYSALTAAKRVKCK